MNSAAKAAGLAQVVYQPVSVVVTAFHKDDVKRPLDGFGVLIPSKEQGNNFGTLGKQLPKDFVFVLHSFESCGSSWSLGLFAGRNAVFIFHVP